MNPLLLCDFYKTVHSEQYPKKMNYLVSYLTPRMSRLEDTEELIFFGLQGFIKEYLIDYFNENFFKKDLDFVVLEYERVLKYTLGDGCFDSSKVSKLHKLGYLPLSIRSVDEGTKIPMKIPVIEICNTHPEFAWLVNTIETLMSCSLWHAMISANVGHKYRQIVNTWYDRTVDDADLYKKNAIGDFSMRGQESLESATKSSAGFLLSFAKTATIPAILWLERYYNCNIEDKNIASGGISTEHSVMCSNFANDGDEITMVKRLLTEIYPNHSFSMVGDSYDYWNMIDNILPACKSEIMNHNGTLYIRGDSGDPVNIVVNSVLKLWDHFGGYYNKKGFKVLDDHIRVIYGDSITPNRAQRIYSLLYNYGFASNNVALGAGSFSLQCYEDESGKLFPYTRDTFGIAIKSTYCEIDGQPMHIFKDPKTDSGFKKSQKGMCVVYSDYNVMHCEDGLNRKNFDSWLMQNMLRARFYDGEILGETSLLDIRQKLNNERFQEDEKVAI